MFPFNTGRSQSQKKTPTKDDPIRVYWKINFPSLAVKKKLVAICWISCSDFFSTLNTPCYIFTPFLTPWC